ncbi:MAG: FHA domain-containing protein [Thermodesulfovibrionales bacterium]|nr:FHA domain-containing protein [Thermodesulfovibrionales bacterium]
MAKAILTFQDTVIKDYLLDKDIITIGRKPDNDIRIDNLAVSGYHAKIIVGKDAIFIEDNNSLNGTFVNGAKVIKHQLRHGDKVNIGKHIIIFDIPEEAGKTPPVTRPQSMDETLVISPDIQQRYIKQSTSLTTASTSGTEPLGGFAVIEGALDQKEYILKDRVSRIGKEDDAEIRVRGLFKPKVAAIINRKKDGYFISPSSKKPLKINGEDITGRRQLNDGDIVEVVGVKLQFFIKE